MAIKNKYKLFMLATLVILIFFVSGNVLASTANLRTETWRLTFSVREGSDLNPAAARGMHILSYHNQAKVFDVFPLATSSVHVSEARYNLAAGSLVPGEEIMMRLCTIDENGEVQRILGEKILSTEQASFQVWEEVELDGSFLRENEYLAFHYQSLSGAPIDLKIAYEVNVFSGYSGFLPLIFR